MVRSLYTSADMEENLSITFEPVDRFKHMRGHFGVVFKANPMVRSLYTSAHMEEDTHITFYLGYGCQHIRGQFALKREGSSSVQIHDL